MALQLRPNCEYCDKDLPPNAVGRADLFLRMHVLLGLRGQQAAQCLPELRRRLCAAAVRPATERRPGVCVTKQLPSDKRVHLK